MLRSGVFKPTDVEKTLQVRENPLQRYKLRIDFIQHQAQIGQKRTLIGGCGDDFLGALSTQATLIVDAGDETFKQPGEKLRVGWEQRLG